MSVTAESVLRRRDGVVSRSLEDARIVLRLERSETLIFNAAANRLWDWFDGTRSIAAIASETGYTPAVLAAFAEQLIEMSLFEAVDAPAAATAQAQSAPAMAEALLAASDPAAQMALPALLGREELAVLGGCTSSGLLCSFPSSGAGGGSGRGGRVHP